MGGVYIRAKKTEYNLMTDTRWIVKGIPAPHNYDMIDSHHPLYNRSLFFDMPPRHFLLGMGWDRLSWLFCGKREG